MLLPVQPLASTQCPTIFVAGRPKQYGKKVKLRTLFDNPDVMCEGNSPLYGEKNVLLRYRCVDLLLKRIGILVRFVAVIHPSRG